MLTQAKLAEFHNTSDRSVRRWSAEEKHRKTVQLEADVTTLEWQLVGEIAQLCYLYNAQNWRGALTNDFAVCGFSATGISVSFYVSAQFNAQKELRAKTSNTAEMQLIKMQLEKLVYGGEK